MLCTGARVQMPSANVWTTVFASSNGTQTRAHTAAMKRTEETCKNEKSALSGSNFPA